MKIKFICPIWGMEDPTLEAKLEKIKEAGYDGVEMGASQDNKEREHAKNLLEKFDLMFIGQQWTDGNDIDEHFKSFEKQVRINSELNPYLINSHTGKDYFSLEENKRLFELTTNLAKNYNFKIIHETHRGRFTFSAMSTSEFINSFDNLELAADFSHWCCVSESYLEDQTQFVKEAINRTVHLHARVGYPQGPQVTDPRAPEWQYALQTHLNWWDKIIESNRKKGFSIQTIAPEFGPVEYLPTLPFTNKPVSDQWEINLFMKDLLKERYG